MKVLHAFAHHNDIIALVKWNFLYGLPLYTVYAPERRIWDRPNTAQTPFLLAPTVMNRRFHFDSVLGMAWKISYIISWLHVITCQPKYVICETAVPKSYFGQFLLPPLVYGLPVGFPPLILINFVCRKLIALVHGNVAWKKKNFLSRETSTQSD